ncbi:pyruvate dehydrogenase (acetyl-transferring) E1 component subunit alpha [Alteribacillus iranensis]|uniref:Pyruvate dehydrogenase E1 component subunit alpha n=1 Tax=Alteribacillus iranensis TaxID=930128 RepID=A0A1I2ACT7_9BACI|nr:pyruvate dehydrogenase (acetyl-transferring) E1 component subunit alpha [Alteribacillus iranensis]SFE41824.1 pyruvate dehydrogenase E1 component alpha subunit [Alteribacillus iranensis]
MNFPLVRCIKEDGNMVDPSLKEKISEELVKKFYFHMKRIRAFDRSAKNLQRQGRLGTYAMYEGQEAAQVGSALALDTMDWMLPTYRDHGALLTHGAEMMRVLLYWNGRMEGSFHPGKRIFPPAVPIATQLPHAVGTAWAEVRKGTNNACLVYFGDGATSEGDFHEGLNFASVLKSPVVFFNQNNGYAISVPVYKQMNSESIVQKSVAYGIPGIRVDGNDIVAVYFETQKALERAKKGEGPTLIEAVTQRFGAHTTADDPSKYRDQEEVERQREHVDPIRRLERFMHKHGFENETWIKETEKAIETEIQEAIMEMENFPKAEIEDIFDHVFEIMPRSIVEQKNEYMEWIRGEKV